MTSLIEAKGLTKRYQGREVVKAVNMQIFKGETIALIGENGAGKSTTISMLLGILQPDEGVVTRWRKDYRAHVGVQLQSTPFFEGYTAEENMALFGALYKLKLSKEQIGKELAKCSLTEAAKTPAIKLSMGQQKRLAIAVTTIHQPDLIVLDEPTAGLDPRARQEVRTMIRQLTDCGVTVLFSSHDMEEVKRTASRLILMHSGRVVAQGTPQDLLRDHNVEDLETLYLNLTKTA